MKSELRLIETLDGICDRILQYNIHKVSQNYLLCLNINIITQFSENVKMGLFLILFFNQERKDSTRFAKGQSETFSTLEGLVAKGVKVGSNHLKTKLIV